MADAEAPDEVVDELYGAPLDEFTARRDALAKELRKSDRAAADAVKKLRKPSVAAAAVNALVRRRPEDVEALLAAGEALRQAQLGGGDREAIRAASRDEREAVEGLVADAASHGVTALDEVRATLHAAALDEGARESVRRGVLTAAVQAAGFGGFGGFTTAPASDRKNSNKGGGRKAAAVREAPAEDEAEAARKAEAAREAEAERRRAAKERVKAAKAALKDAEKAAKAADRDRATAEKALQKAQTKADDAQAEVEKRRTELEEAEAKLA